MTVEGDVPVPCACACSSDAQPRGESDEPNVGLAKGCFNYHTARARTSAGGYNTDHGADQDADHQADHGAYSGARGGLDRGAHQGADHQADRTAHSGGSNSTNHSAHQGAQHQADREARSGPRGGTKGGMIAVSPTSTTPAPAAGTAIHGVASGGVDHPAERGALASAREDIVPDVGLAKSCFNYPTARARTSDGGCTTDHGADQGAVHQADHSACSGVRGGLDHGAHQGVDHRADRAARSGGDGLLHSGDKTGGRTVPGPNDCPRCGSAVDAFTCADCHRPVVICFNAYDPPGTCDFVMSYCVCLPAPAAAAATPSPNALPASKPSQAGQPARDAPLIASQAALAPLTAVRSDLPPRLVGPGDPLSLANATSATTTPAPTASGGTKEPRPAPPPLPLSLERARERQRELAASTGAFGAFTAPKPNVTSLPTPVPSAPPAPADRALEPPFARPSQRAAVTVEDVKQQADAWMESLQEGLASDPPEWVQTIADDIALATAFWR